jgi:hypothetical protein
MTDLFPVRIYESELQVICDETLGYPDIETGGNLYGHVSYGGTPVIWLASRPAGNVYRGNVVLELDPHVTNRMQNFIWEQHGLQFLGMWHSHHQIGLYQPSEGDRRRTANFAVKWDRKFYVEILCNLPRGGAAPRVEVAPKCDPVTDETADQEADEGADEGTSTRKERRAQAREEKRRARQASQGRFPGPVILTPFAYTDAPHLVQANAEISVMPGVSPLRAALATAQLAGDFAEALRPVSGDHADLKYELRTSRADHFDTQDRFTDHAPAPEQRPQVTAVPTEERRPAGSEQTSPAIALGPDSPSDRNAQITGVAIPDMQDYLERFVAPLIAAHPSFAESAKFRPDGSKNWVITIASHRRPARFLLVLGWNGSAPVVISSAIRSGDGRATRPTGVDRRDLPGHFSWGIRQL